MKSNEDIIPENVRGRIYVQKSVGNLATKNSNKYFELISDIVLEGEEKYVYCKEVGAKKCLLIYPEVHNGRIESHWELGRDKIKLYVRTVSLAHDLTTKEGKEAFVEDLKRVLSCLA